MSNPYANPEIQAHYDRKMRRAMARMAQALTIDPKPWGELVGINPAQVRPQDFASEELFAGAYTHMWEQIVLHLKKGDVFRLHTEVSAIIAGGVPTASTELLDNPFVLSIIGICDKDIHGGRGPLQQQVVMKTYRRLDQTEAEEQIKRVTANPNVHLCEVCGKKITTWQTDMCRFRDLAAREIKEGARIMEEAAGATLGEEALRP